MRINYFLFLILFLKAGASKAQSLYDQESSKQFATYLYASGNYRLAATEYERLLFLEPNNDSLRQRILKSMLLSEDFEGSNKRALLFNEPADRLSNGMANLYSYGLISAGNQQAVRTFLNINQNLNKEEKLYYQAYSYLLENEFKKAQQLKSESQVIMDSRLAALIAETETIKHKHPALAAGMSALIPGLVTVGVTGYQSYRGFNRNGINSGYGWIYGSLAAGFYLGNIYGSASSAKRFNKREIDKVAQRIRHSFMLRP
jgi:tetratricopeptide (TPR) repeat protein